MEQKPIPDLSFLSPKLIPWFVSDVTPVDFKNTFKVLRDPTFFPADIGSDIEHKNLDYMVSRWNSYLEKGIFSLSVPQETPLGGGTLNAKVAEYWTTGRPYWDMETEAPELFAGLVGSGLVIFKVSFYFMLPTRVIEYRTTLGRRQVSHVSITSKTCLNFQFIPSATESEAFYLFKRKVLRSNFDFRLTGDVRWPAWTSFGTALGQ